MASFDVTLDVEFFRPLLSRKIDRYFLAEVAGLAGIIGDLNATRVTIGDHFFRPIRRGTTTSCPDIVDGEHFTGHIAVGKIHLYWHALPYVPEIVPGGRQPLDFRTKKYSRNNDKQEQ